VRIPLLRSSPSYLTHAFATSRLTTLSSYHFLNMTLIRDQLYSSYHAHKFWRLLHDQQDANHSIIPDCLPTLHIDSLRAIHRFGPQCLGRYFATVEWCVKATMMFVLVNQQTPAQRQIWSDYLRSQFAADQLCCLDTHSLIDLVEALHESRRDSAPGTRLHERRFHHLHTARNEQRAEDYNRTLVTAFMSHWITACLPYIKSRFSTLQSNTICYGYGQGRLHYRDMRNPGVFPAITYYRVQATNHSPFGPLVPPYSFCTYRPVLACSICAICTRPINDPPDDHRDYPVTLRCAHFFHQPCLNGWMNLSARIDADECPVCSTIICWAGRQRLGVPARQVS
jgi:hypothetical protein